MSVNYSISEINARLQGTVTAIGQSGSGFLKLLTAGGATVSSIQLQNPCGTVANGNLTLSGTLLDASAAGGKPTQAIFTDTNGNVMISGLVVSTAATADIQISTATITAGQAIQLLSSAATIQGA